MAAGLVFAICAVLAPASLAVSTVTVLAADHEQFSHHGRMPGIGRTFTGLTVAASTTIHYNSYFLFDLPEIAGEIVSAKLQLQFQQYYGTDAWEEVVLHDVTSSVADLTAISYTEGTAEAATAIAIHEDLMTGETYGSALIQSTALAGNIIEFTLNANALLALNQGGYFAVGLHLASLSDAGVEEGVRFAPRKSPSVHKLQLLAVPDTGGNAVLLAMAGGMLLWVRRMVSGGR